MDKEDALTISDDADVADARHRPLQLEQEALSHRCLVRPRRGCRFVNRRKKGRHGRARCLRERMRVGDELVNADGVWG